MEVAKADTDHHNETANERVLGTVPRLHTTTQQSGRKFFLLSYRLQTRGFKLIVPRIQSAGNGTSELHWALALLLAVTEDLPCCEKQLSWGSVRL